MLTKHNFGMGADYGTILSETRKYKLGLVMASQTLAQLSKPTVDAIFADVASMVSYRVSHDDAQALVRHFGVSGEGPITAEEAYDIVPVARLQNLPDYTFYFQNIVNGRPEAPRVVNAYPPITGDDMRRVFGHRGKTTDKARVIQQSVERYGRDRKEVEAELYQFLPHKF